MKENFVYLIGYFLFFIFFISIMTFRYYDRIDKKTNISPFRDKNSENYRLTKEYIRNLVISFIIFLVLGFFFLLFLILLENPDIINRSTTSILDN